MKEAGDCVSYPGHLAPRRSCFWRRADRRDRSYRATSREAGAEKGDPERTCDPRQCVNCRRREGAQGGGKPGRDDRWGALVAGERGKRVREAQHGADQPRINARVIAPRN